MISARIGPRISAVIYGALGVLMLLWIAAMWKMASSTAAGSIAQAASVRATRDFPIAFITAAGYLALSGLSFRLLLLPRPWQLATVVGSLLVALLAIPGPTRESIFLIPQYSAIGYVHLTAALGIIWAPALALALCLYLVWKSFRAPRNS